MTDTRPIGVFDSGVGGLTVLRALHHDLPHERLIYIADLEHFPYGPRYQHEVKDFALKIIEYLIGRDVKLVVIACNTATAAALNAARETFDVPIVGVIAPGAQAAVAATHNGRIAVISTEGTHTSQEYVHAIKEADPGVGVLSKAAPDLVEIVEAGDATSPRAHKAVADLLSEVTDWGADTLVLGCTHYPLLRPVIAEVLGKRGVHVVDSAETTSERVARILQRNRLVSESETGDIELLVTGHPERFSKVAKQLFGEDIGEPVLVDLWHSATAPVS